MSTSLMPMRVCGLATAKKFAHLWHKRINCQVNKWSRLFYVSSNYLFLQHSAAGLYFVRPRPSVLGKEKKFIMKNSLTHNCLCYLFSRPEYYFRKIISWHIYDLDLKDSLCVFMVVSDILDDVKSEIFFNSTRIGV